MSVPTEVEKHEKSATTTKVSQNFSFQAFMEKMRDPEAVGIVQELKTFITNVWELPMDTDIIVISQMVHAFYLKMEAVIENHALFKDADLDERINTIEGIEKYLLTKIYDRVFGSRGDADIRSDNILLRRFASLEFIEPVHLDIPENHIQSTTLRVAEGELLKMNMYKSPRDKLTCISNCCVVLGKILSLTKSGDHGADEFLPLLIYALIHSNPPRLKSNIEYIGLFRNPSRLIGESAYFFTNLTSGVHFIENLKHSDLTIDPREFERLQTEYLNHFDLRQLVVPVRTPSTPYQVAVRTEPRGPENIHALSSSGASEFMYAAAADAETMNRLRKFVDTPFADLRYGDIPELLENYKSLIALYDQLILQKSVNESEPENQLE